MTHLPVQQSCSEDALAPTQTATSAPPRATAASQQRHPLGRAAQHRWLRFAARDPLAELAGKRPSGDRQVDRLLRQLEIHLFEPGFTIEEALLICDIRSKMFAKDFRQLCGKSPGEVVTAARLNCADTLLTCSPLGIRSIARLVGYRSQQGFQRAYRRLRGETPRRARQRLAPSKAQADAARVHFTHGRYPRVDRRIADSLWREIETMDSIGQAMQFLDNLSWEGDTLFESGQHRTSELRGRQPRQALWVCQLLHYLAETQGRVDLWARARMEQGLTEYLHGTNDHLRNALAEVENLEVCDSRVSFLVAASTCMLGDQESV